VEALNRNIYKYNYRKLLECKHTGWLNKNRTCLRYRMFAAMTDNYDHTIY